MSSLVLDISNWQETPNWRLLKLHGIDAVYLKATQGLTFNDKTFQARRREARNVGLHVGAYHFADLHDPQAEANHFIRVVGAMKKGDLIPALDVETPGTEKIAQMFSREFNAIVHNEFGYWPLFYSNSGYITMIPHLDRPIGGGLWLANYGRNDGKEHPFTIPAPWKRTVMHQFSSDCSVIGCTGKVDLSTTANLSSLIV